MEGVRPHDLHVGVVLSSEEAVAAVRPHHVPVHSELHLPPELAVLLRAHGQSAKHTALAATGPDRTGWGGGESTGTALHRG